MSDSTHIELDKSRPGLVVDVDVETTSLQWYAGNVFLAQFSDGSTASDGSLLVEVLEHPKDRERIQEWLDPDLWHESTEWAAHNSKFDAHFLLDAEGIRIAPLERWHDSMVMAHLVDERIPAALKIRHERMFGKGARDEENAIKDWLAAEKRRRTKEHKEALYQWLEKEGYEQKRNKLPQVPPGLVLPERLRGRAVPPNYSDVPSEHMVPYAAQDIVLTRQLRSSLRARMDDSLVKLYEEIERPVMGALFEMERRGLPVDKAAMQRLAHASAERLESLEALAVDLSGKRNFNPGSPKQVVEALHRQGADLQFVGLSASAAKSGLSRKEATERGMLSMDEENLSAVDHPLAQAILDFRGESKVLGTYVLPALNGDGERAPFIVPMTTYDEVCDRPLARLHTSIRQVGARTGRMSSADPNLQNWPRDDLRLKYTIRADPGKVFIAADMEQIEARVLAFYTLAVGGGPLVEMVQNGEDIHTYTAKMTSLTGRQRINGFETPRQQGKRLNYLKMYGGGVRAIRKFFLVPQARAREINELYTRAYPEIARLSDQIQWRLSQRGYVQTLYGRKQRLERSVREEGYKFLNYLIQGTAADMFKIATVRLHREGVPIVAAVHDELVAHVPEADAERTAKLMETALSDFPDVTRLVPLAAEASIVQRWSDTKKPGYVPDHEQETHTQQRRTEDAGSGGA